MRKSIKTAAVVAAMSVMVLGTVASVSAAEKKNGWVQNGTNWYYYDNDKMFTNAWVQSNGKWYFFDEDGKMATSRFVNDNELVDKADVSSHIMTPSEDDLYYYVGSDGAMVTGWNEVDTQDNSGPSKTGKLWFYMSTTGRVYGEEWVYSGNDWYYLGANGEMYKQKVDDCDTDEEFYFKKSGAMVSGWYKLTSDDENKVNGAGSIGDWIYANADGELVKSGWEKIDGNWYFFGDTDATWVVDVDDIDGQGLSTVSGSSISVDDYTMVSNAIIRVGKEYFNLKSNGAMSTSAWVKTKDSSKNTVYYYADGSKGLLLTNKVQSINNKYSYFVDGVFTEKIGTTSIEYVVEYNDGTFEPVLKGAESSITTAFEAAKVTATANGTTVKKVYKLDSNTSKQ